MAHSAPSPQLPTPLIQRRGKLDGGWRRGSPECDAVPRSSCLDRQGRSIRRPKSLSEIVARQLLCPPLATDPFIHIPGTPSHGAVHSHSRELFGNQIALRNCRALTALPKPERNRSRGKLNGALRVATDSRSLKMHTTITCEIRRCTSADGSLESLPQLLATGFSPWSNKTNLVAHCK